MYKLERVTNRKEYFLGKRGERRVSDDMKREVKIDLRHFVIDVTETIEQR